MVLSTKEFEVAPGKFQSLDYTWVDVRLMGRTTSGEDKKL